MKSLYIHLGTGKAGSTAIQRFLNENESLMVEREGIQYAETSRRLRNHHLLCTSFHRNRGGDASDAVRNIEGLADEIDRSACGSFVVSAECFPGVTEEEIDKVYTGILGAVAEVHVIVYFRRQDEFLESWYAQRLKAGQSGAADGIERLYSRLSSAGIFDYKGLVDAWARHVGCENVHVRPFERSQFLGGDVVHDFMSIFGVHDLSDYSIPGKDPNPSLSRDQARIVEAFHRSGLEDRLDGRLRRPFDIDSPHSRFVMSPARRQEVVDEWSQVNSAVARDYLGRPDGDLFRSPGPVANGEADDDFQYPTPEFMFRAIQHMIDREVVPLRQQISALQERLEERDRVRGH